MKRLFENKKCLSYIAYNTEVSMLSMTGFASHEEKTEFATYSFRMKSLNSRFLDLKIILPQALQDMEEDLRKIIQKEIQRGKVELSLQMRLEPNQSEKLVYNRAQAQEAVKILKTISKEYDLEFSKISELFEVTNPIKQEGLKISKKEEKQKILNALGQTIEKLQKKRKKEGQASKKELKILLQEIKKHLSNIEKKRIQIMKNMENRFVEKIKKLELESLEPQRLQHEIALLIDKSDIHEEITRLSEHLGHFQDLLEEGGGKRLDFYTQELLRETNTIGSKAHDKEITTEIIEIKCNIERIRELVQNLE